ncbi:ATP-dependent DNA helicase, partial [Halorubrum sp. SS5]
GATTTSNLVSEARSQQVGLMDSGTDAGSPADGPAADYLSVDGEPTPYRPDTEEYDDVEFCPFYAGFLDDLPEDGDPAEAVPFDVTELGHVDADELVRLAAGHGSCP